MSMSLSSWSEAHEDLSELRLKRQIGYINGVFEASSLDCNRIRQAVEHAWKGALLPKTAIAELVYGTESITADHSEVAGFLQKTSYGTVWADLIAEAEDSGFLHPDGYNGQRFTESWRLNGYSCYDHNPMAWFAQFSAAIAHEDFKLSSLKSRMKLNQMMQRMPDPQWVCQNLRCKYTTK